MSGSQLSSPHRIFDRIAHGGTHLTEGGLDESVIFEDAAHETWTVVAKPRSATPPEHVDDHDLVVRRALGEGRLASLHVVGEDIHTRQLYGEDGLIRADTLVLRRAKLPRQRVRSSESFESDETAPTEELFRMRLDANRNGSIDHAAAPTRWTWGASGRGAIVVVNNDDDAPTGGGALDNTDRVIDAGNDTHEITPLLIEHIARASVPPGTTLELSVSPPDVIRIFAGTTAGRTEIIGPNTGWSHRISTLPTRHPLRFGMEGLRYASTGFNGEITLTLTTTPPSGTPIVAQTVVRVAPWIMPNHLNAARKVFVVDVGASNSRFRTELGRLVAAAGCTVQEHASHDRWMQDALEFGFSSLPSRGFRAVLRAARDRDLQTFPRTLLGADLGYIEQGTLTPFTTYDSHGNLEASPPVTLPNGKRYPFGRIYFGPGDAFERFDAEVADFLRAQVVQEPFEVDTSWLTVGHVDEIISFVPANSGAGGKSFRMLLASPRLGYQILDRLGRTDPTARMFVGRNLDGTNIETTVRDFLTWQDDFNPALRSRIASGRVTHTVQPLRTYNDACQLNLDAVKATMQRELGLVDADIIEVPSVFMPNPRTPTLADALIPGMVNMLVLNQHCIVPKPFGPIVSSRDIFERELRTKLTRLGLHVSFLDCWEEYHVKLGEVHCGTNTLRSRTHAEWWRFTP